MMLYLFQKQYPGNCYLTLCSSAVFYWLGLLLQKFLFSLSKQENKENFKGSLTFSNIYLACTPLCLGDPIQISRSTT